METPIIHLKKQDIVKKAVEYQAPLEHTWSCYANVDLAYKSYKPEFRNV